ncbi:VOC family protein [Gammaproteobacteria bacterium]|nr:VOC family protein [Gammaproteobacteria bacterium]
MDIRQIVMVSGLRDPIVNDLCELFNFEVAFNDPGVAHFGLENAVIPIGTDFIEVVSPVEENTTAGRYLNKRGGDGGYMIIIQVDKFEDSQKLVNEYNIKTVWETDLPKAKAMHLHPKQMGGAILSLDWMEPKESWKWAGPNWEKNISGPIKGIDGVEIQSDDPELMLNTWLRVLGDVERDHENKILLDNTWIKFSQATDGRGPGISAFSLKAENSNEIIERAQNLGFMVDDKITIGGVKFYLK